MAQRQHSGSHKSIWAKGKRGKGNKRDREDRLRNPPCNSTGLVTSLREEEERRILTYLGGSFWGTVSCGPMDTPESNPGQSSSVVSTAAGLFAESVRRKNRGENHREAIAEAVPDVCTSPK